jgi:hypothetical protein
VERFVSLREEYQQQHGRAYDDTSIRGGDQERVLFDADDMKLFLPVSGFQDCLKVQSDLNKLSEWCNRNSLLLNV